METLTFLVSLAPELKGWESEVPMSISLLMLYFGFGLVLIGSVHDSATTIVIGFLLQIASLFVVPMDLSFWNYFWIILSWILFVMYLIGRDLWAIMSSAISLIIYLLFVYFYPFLT